MMEYLTFHYKNGCTTHPHNFYLQLLSETGIFGFLFIILLFIYLVYTFNMFFLNRESIKFLKSI